MTLKEQLIEAVEANVEDFCGDTDSEDIIIMSVEDALHAYNVHPQTQYDYWDLLCDTAREKYQVIYED